MKRFLSICIFLLFCWISIAQETDRYPFYRDGLWGFIDHTCQEVIPAQYYSAGSFSEGLAAVRKGSYYGYIDPAGKTVIKPKYDFCEAFRNGTAVAYTGERQAYLISNKGKKLAGPYKQVVKLLGTEQILVEGPKGFGMLSPTGKIVLQPVYDELRLFSDGRWLLGQYDTSGTCYGLAGSDGTIISAPDPGEPHSRLMIQYGIDQVKNKPRIDSLIALRTQEPKALQLHGDYDFDVTQNDYCYTDSTGRIVKAFTVPVETSTHNYDYCIVFSTTPPRTTETAYSISPGETTSSCFPPAEMLVRTSEKGHWVTIVNTSSDTLRLPVYNESLQLYVQARDKKGKWKDITMLPSKGDYMTQDLAHLGFMEEIGFQLPEMRGGMRTELRVRLTCFVDFDPKSRTAYYTNVYSNTFKGTINPAQLWNTRCNTPLFSR